MDYFMTYFLGVGTVLAVLYGLLKWLLPKLVELVFGWFFKAH